MLTVAHLSASIFKLGEELDDNPMTLTILFLIMAGLSFMFEKSTHWLEHVRASQP